VLLRGAPAHRGHRRQDGGGRGTDWAPHRAQPGALQAPGVLAGGCCLPDGAVPHELAAAADGRGAGCCLAQLRAGSPAAAAASCTAVAWRAAQAWGADSTGLLVSERLVNSPPQLAPPLQQALFDEIAWATEDEPTAELRASFQLQRYVALSRAYCDPAAARPRGKRAKGEEVRAPPSGDGAAVRPAVSARGGRGRARPSARPSAQEPVVVYARPEDEFYHRHCTWSYTFPVTSRPLRKDELQPLRLVMLLSPEQVAAARWPPSSRNSLLHWRAGLQTLLRLLRHLRRPSLRTGRSLMRRLATLQPDTRCVEPCLLGYGGLAWASDMWALLVAR